MMGFYPHTCKMYNLQRRVVKSPLHTYLLPAKPRFRGFRQVAFSYRSPDFGASLGQLEGFLLLPFQRFVGRRRSSSTEQSFSTCVVITSSVSHEPDDSIRSLELVMLAIIASTASAYSPGLSSLPVAAAVHHRTCASPLMGGFEQKYFSKDGARLALLISDAPSLAAADVSKACAAVDGLSGVVYQLDGRIELVAEGVKPSLDALVSELQQLRAPLHLCGGLARPGGRIHIWISRDRLQAEDGS